MTPDLDRMTADLAALVAISSINPFDAPPGIGLREAELADWLTGAMEEIGLATGRREIAPGRPNVWGRLNGAGGGPVLMLAGHTDTIGVESYNGDPLAPEIREGRLYGRGAVDMKGALASFLEVARQAKRLALAGDLLLMFVVDEEHQMIGSRAAGRDGPHADMCVVGEPTGLAVCVAHKGQMAFPVTVHGRPAHSSRPDLGVNAISGAARVIGSMGPYAEALARTPHPLCGPAHLTPVLIDGGEAHSAVPARAVVTFDRRTLPGETARGVREELESALAPSRSEGWSVSLGAASPDVPPLDTPADSAVARAALAAAEAACLAAEPHAFPAGTDAPNFGCPAVVCGPGDLARAHTDDEFIELEQLRGAASLYLDIVGRVLG